MYPRTEKVYTGFALENVDSKSIEQLQNTLSFPYSIVMTYKQWGNPNNSSITPDFLEIFNKAHKIPLITWEPWNPANGIYQPAFQLRKITEVYYDTYITVTAKNIRTYGKPIFLRFAHEMNINRYPWSGNTNHNTPQEYINAWRHIHHIFSSVGTKNVTWVWSPNVDGDSLEKYYPGDEYVDWVGLDGYNWGKATPGKSWQSFSDIFLLDYLSITSFTKKPLMIAEMASTEPGGNKAKWIEDAYQYQIPKNFPRISAVIWFNINKETNWTIDSSSESLKSFKKALSVPVYKTSPQIQEGKIFPDSL